MKRYQEEVAAIIAKDPNIEGFMSSIGGGRGSNTGSFFMRLKPRNQRTLSADEIIQELRPKLATVAGVRVFLKNIPSIQIGGTSSKSQYQFTLQGQDTGELYRSAEDFEAKLREIGELQDVTSDLQISNPQVHVEINRDKLAALGLSVLQVEDALRTHPAVAECAVAALRVEGLLRPCAHVVLKEPGQAQGQAQAKLGAEILRHARTLLPSYMCPVRLEFHTDLPKTPTGKIQRFRLRNA